MVRTMRIELNGNAVDIQSSTIEELLLELNRTKAPCAVERNGELVPWRSRSDVPIHEGDQIEIVTMVGGG